MQLRPSIITVLFLFLLPLLYSACAYPYNTEQARRARKAVRLAQKQARSQQAKSDSMAIADSLRLLDSVRLAEQQRRDSLPKDTTQRPPDKGGKMGGRFTRTLTAADSLRLDSLRTADSLRLANGGDTSKIDSLPLRSSIQFSKDSLDAQVSYGAEDSMIYDLSARKIYLYNKAEVVYKEFRLSAGMITIDLIAMTATAEGIQDTATGRLRQRPFFKDAGQQFEATRIVYNFRTNKGKVYDASTQQGDGYFLSEETKFIAQTGKDERGEEADDIIYSKNCLYTTCNRYEAHFGIRGTRAKVIPNKLIVLGPSYLEIMGVPTPIVLPFAFFPLKKQEGKRSGLIISTNLEFSPTFGPGLRGMGYYWAISDYVDLSLTTDLYLRGSLRLNAVSNYHKRYHYKGSFGFGYSRLIFDDVPTNRVRQDFNIRWEFAQDNKAHPTQTFNASVNFGTSDYFRNAASSANQVLQGQFNSNISYSKRFAGTPFSIMLSASHSQSVQTRMMTITAPKLDVRMNQIFPLKRRNPVGKERWYEKIAFAYNMNAQNRASIVDTVLFAPQGFQKLLDTMEYNIVHNPALTMNFKLFQLINIQPNIRYTEHWFFQAADRSFDPTLIVKNDTIRDSDDNITSIRRDTTWGSLVTDKTRGFYAVRDLSAGINLNTQIFAFNQFSIGRLYRMMAMIRPDVGFRWRPDYQDDFWGYYQQLPTDARYPDKLQSYRRFSYVPAGGKSALLTYGLSGRVEGKWRKSQPDSLTGEKYRNIVLINNWTLSGDYNMAADSLRWSVVRAGANTTLFKLVQVTWAATFDPYTADSTTNTRLNRLEWAENRRLLRLTNMSFNIGGSATSQNLREWFGGAKKPTTPTPQPTQGQQQANVRRDFVEAITLQYNFTFNNKYQNGKDTTIFATNELSLAGSFNLTPKWNFRITRVGYDFTNKRLTFPDFTLSRDLHCWEMGINWQPAPERRTWAFYLRVKPSSLGFISIPARKTVFDEL